MESPKIYEETRPNGYYFAEDHGANVAGVFFLGKRCRKPRYIATACVNDVESIKARIDPSRPRLSVRLLAFGICNNCEGFSKTAHMV